MISADTNGSGAATPLRLLLVEDNADDAALVTDFLGSDFDVTWAGLLCEALDHLGEQSFDLVILDLTLPDSSGLETMERVRAAAQEVPILVRTSRDDDDLAVQAIRLGAQDCLLKTRTSAAYLASEVRKTVERHRLEVDARAAARRERYLTLRDPLTRLPNREMFLERLREDVRFARRYGQRLAVMFLDLNNFKQVNDSLGHAAGDRVLVTVADRIREALRGSDGVCRYGGDEFLVELRRIASPEDAVVVAEKLRLAVSERITVEGTEVPTGASIGVAIYPRDGEEPEELIRRADAAMYEAKRLGGGVRFPPPSRLPDHDPERERRERIQAALASGRILAHYQPIVELPAHRIVAVEALARWRTPEGDLLRPSRFLAEVGRAGMLGEFSEHILKSACRQLAVWTSAGSALTLAVNLCPEQVVDPGFAERARAIAAESGADPERVVLEVPEQDVDPEDDRVVDVIGGLRDEGFRVALDDFGAGSSSLAHLRRLPLTDVKLDRILVADAAVDQADAAILLSLVSLADRIGLTVTAEGVETEAERDLLLAGGCSRMQGHLFGGPKPADEIQV